MKLLPHPYSQCINEPNNETVYEKYLWHIMNNSLMYMPETCQQLCYVDSITKIQKGNQINYQQIWEDCLKLCPKKCYDRYYDYVTHLSDFPTKYYIENLNHTSLIDKTLDYSSLRRNILRLTFRFKDLRLNKIEQRAKLSHSDLSGNIGGTLGCFLGASTLSLIEIVELIYYLLMIFLRKIYVKFKGCFNNVFK